MNFVVLKDVTIEPVFDLLFQAIESIVLARLIRYKVRIPKTAVHAVNYM